MRSILLGLFFLPFLLFSQIKLNVNLEKIETDSKVIFASVIVEQNGNNIHEETLQNGRFKVNLEKGFLYKIFFSKVNHTTKYLLVDTRDLPSNSKKRQILRVTMTYFLEDEKMDFSFLSKTPVGIARFDEQYKKLRWDYDYANLINERISKVLYSL